MGELASILVLFLITSAVWTLDRLGKPARDRRLDRRKFERGRR